MMTLKFRVDKMFEEKIERLLYQVYEFNDLFVKVMKGPNGSLEYTIKNSNDKDVIDFLSTMTEYQMEPTVLALF